VGEGELENTLSGSGSLVKTGTGELTLSGGNDYSGGTIISDGTLIA
ncbi:autotransporter-associated beta strand repeat-containing protein, partial [Salmonella enterica]